MTYVREYWQRTCFISRCKVCFGLNGFPPVFIRPHQSSPEHKPNIPIIHYCFRFLITRCDWQWCCHVSVRCREKSAKFCVFAPKNFRGFFHEIGIAKVVLTPKPRGVAKFRECKLVTVGQRYYGRKKGAEVKHRRGSRGGAQPAPPYFRKAEDF